MTYILVAMFMLTGDSYVEQRHLSLQECAGRAAMARMDVAQSGIEDLIGEVRYLCLKESA